MQKIGILQSERFQRLSKEMFWVITGQVVAIIGTIMLVRLLTEYLEPEQYGQLALGLTVVSLVNRVVMGGITAGIGRYYSIAKEKQDLRGYVLASRRLMVYATLVAMAIGVVLSGGLLYLGYSQWIGLATAALILSVMNGYSSSLSSIQNAARQRAVVALHSGLDAWLKILFVLYIFLWYGSSSTVVVFGYVLSSIFVTGSQIFFLRRLIQTKATKSKENSKNWVLQIWSFSWPFSAWGIFTWMLLVSDRWALEIFSSMHDVGLFAVLFQLGYTPIVLLTGMLVAFIGPILYQRSGDATDQSRNANVHRIAMFITLSCLVVTLVGLLLALALHAWLFRILVSADYRSVSYMFPWALLAGGLFASGQMLALKMMSEIKSAAMLRAKIGTAILGIFFNIYGAAVAGLEGIMVAAVVFSSIYLIWMYFLSTRRSKSSEIVTIT